MQEYSLCGGRDVSVGTHICTSVQLFSAYLLKDYIAIKIKNEVK